MTSVRVGTAEVAYTVSGAGPPVLLLHGAGAGKDINWGFLAALSGRYTLIAPDLPGSGATRDDGAPLQYELLVAQALAAVAAAGHRSVHVVGYSLGAHLAVGLAAAAPASVRSLTAVAGWVRPDAYMRLEFDLWQRLHRTDPEQLARFAVLTGSHPDYLASASTEDVEGLVAAFAPILAAGTARQAEFVGRTDLTAQIGGVTAPTLVVGLSADRQVPVAHSSTLHQAIPGSWYQSLDAGHLAPWQAPHALARPFVEFLDAQSTSA